MMRPVILSRPENSAALLVMRCDGGSVTTSSPGCGDVSMGPRGKRGAGPCAAGGGSALWARGGGGGGPGGGGVGSSAPGGGGSDRDCTLPSYGPPLGGAPGGPPGAGG